MSSDLHPKVPQAMDLAALRAKLAQQDGKRFWQSLEELSETKEYREFLENEFPHDPAKDPEGLNRRDVLKLAAASAALAGLSACTKLPTQKNCAVREGAGRNRRRQAALLRHVHASRGSRRGPAGG